MKTVLTNSIYGRRQIRHAFIKWLGSYLPQSAVRAEWIRFSKLLNNSQIITTKPIKRG